MEIVVVAQASPPLAAVLGAKSAPNPVLDELDATLPADGAKPKSSNPFTEAAEETEGAVSLKPSLAVSLAEGEAIAAVEVPEALTDSLSLPFAGGGVSNTAFPPLLDEALD